MDDAGNHALVVPLARRCNVTKTQRLSKCIYRSDPTMGTRKMGIRRLMTSNQVVAYNVAKAWAIRGWTQEQAAEELAPYLGPSSQGRASRL
jgi:hypothetical protein